MRCCRQSGQTRRKTYGSGETQDHAAFRTNLLYTTEVPVHTGQVNSIINKVIMCFQPISEIKDWRELDAYLEQDVILHPIRKNKNEKTLTKLTS